MRVIVDYDLCESHGRCVEAAPAVFEIRDDDQMYVLQEHPEQSLRGAVEAAVANCPRQALQLEE